MPKVGDILIGNLTGRRFSVIQILSNTPKVLQIQASACGSVFMIDWPNRNYSLEYTKKTTPRFKVGERVQSANSDLRGKITDIDTSHKFPYYVKWDQGFGSSYKEDELIRERLKKDPFAVTLPSGKALDSKVAENSKFYGRSSWVSTPYETPHLSPPSCITHTPCDTGIPGGATWCINCDKDIIFRGDKWTLK